MEFTAFAAAVKEEGFDEVIERTWEPNTILAEHTHPFDARVRLVRGEMWLTARGRTTHVLPGGTFDVPANLPHAERYGASGATYWVARRNTPASDSPRPSRGTS